MTTEQLIKEAHLRFSTDAKTGWSRKKDGQKFNYHDEDGQLVKDQEQINRIDGLAIPPAWKDVWICPNPLGYIQATGRDEKGRKQYRYHGLWNQKAQDEKFSHMLEFGKLLPKIRRRVQRDMRKRGLPREKVLATIVWLLEKTLIRVGNEEYVKENQSYGLTTLRNRHVKVRGSKIMFEFKGKSGVHHRLGITNKKVAEIVRRCQDLPGQELFEYVDGEGNRQVINSEDVNDYLYQITKKDISAKDFRTWAGTNLAAEMLDEQGLCDDEVMVKKVVIETVKKVSSHLRNRPNTCKKYYIHPFIFKAYAEGVIISNHNPRKKSVEVRMMTDCEKKVLAMLQNAV